LENIIYIVQSTIYTPTPQTLFSCIQNFQLNLTLVDCLLLDSLASPVSRICNMIETTFRRNQGVHSYTPLLKHDSEEIISDQEYNSESEEMGELSGKFNTILPPLESRLPSTSCIDHVRIKWNSYLQYRTDWQMEWHPANKTLLRFIFLPTISFPSRDTLSTNPTTTFQPQFNQINFPQRQVRDPQTPPRAFHTSTQSRTYPRFTTRYPISRYCMP